MSRTPRWEAVRTGFRMDDPVASGVPSEAVSRDEVEPAAARWRTACAG